MVKKTAKKKTITTRAKPKLARKKATKKTSKPIPQPVHTSQSKVVKPTVGKNLPTVLSKTIVKTPYAAVGGLVCTAYNYDATEVFINVDETLRTLEIKYEGPGTGMDQEGIREFLTLGGQIKGETPVLHRKRVGQKRLTRAFIGYLGTTFSIRSIKNGHLHSIEDAFVDGELTGDKRKVSEPEGTTLTIKGLTREPNKAFRNKLLLRL